MVQKINLVPLTHFFVLCFWKNSLYSWLFKHLFSDTSTEIYRFFHIPQLCLPAVKILRTHYRCILSNYAFSYCVNDTSVVSVGNARYFKMEVQIIPLTTPASLMLWEFANYKDKQWRIGWGGGAWDVPLSNFIFMCMTKFSVKMLSNDRLAQRPLGNNGSATGKIGTLFYPPILI